MEDETPKYRIKVNQRVVTKFFTNPVSVATPQDIAEVNKVISVVMNHYYAKYSYLFRELRAAVWVVLLERHKNYDPQWSAYNYCYRIARNECGNFVAKYFTRESLPDEFPDVRSTELEVSMDEVGSLLPYLTGEVSFTRMRVPSGLVFPLLKFVEEGLRVDVDYSELVRVLITINYE